MCHRISSYSTFFYRINDHYLCGRKKFNLYKGGIYPYISSKSYWVSKPNAYYCLSTEPIEQKLIMALNSHSLDIPESDLKEYDISVIETHIKAGIHISPFCDNIKKDFCITETYINIPVLFEERSVLFYDGIDVSVSELFLPDIKMMLEILKKSETFGSKKEFMAKYKALFSILNQQMRKQERMQTSNNKQKEK